MGFGGAPGTGQRFAGGRAARALCLQAPRKPGLGSGCFEQVTGSQMWLQGVISGFKKARGYLQTRSV